MANLFKAQILTPDGTLFDGEVTGVQVPGSSGDFLMLFNHAPIVSTLGIGPVILKKNDETEIQFAITGGFVEMNENSMTLLAEKAEEASAIDVKEARRLYDDAKARMKDKKADLELAERDLKIAKNKLKVAE
ncbi:MAG: ATP synthase F1 subunit epsilon [Balneolaceae bacterium]|nr:MAG: ATP synthase F1 subunit epsilon [Balneolaceae bacterium]